MTVPPPPAQPCMRVRLDFQTASGTDMGSRFFLQYAGGAPSAANCASIATSIAAFWATRLSQLCYQLTSLVEVDVEDIATNLGAFGSVAVSHPGQMSAGSLVNQAAVNVEFDITRRYRGGKPRMFLPAPDGTALASQDKWSQAFIGTVNAEVAGFFSDIEALNVGSVGALEHVNLSYYQGFTNVTNSSGRTRAAPKYRSPVALVDKVTGYACKAVVGSQRRRRTATSF